MLQSINVNVSEIFEVGIKKEFHIIDLFVLENMS